LLACLLTRLLYSTHSLSVVALSHYFQATGKTHFWLGIEATALGDFCIYSPVYNRIYDGRSNFELQTCRERQ